MDDLGAELIHLSHQLALCGFTLSFDLTTGLLAGLIHSVGAESTTDKPYKKLWAQSFLGKPAPKLQAEQWIGTAPDTKGKYVLVDRIRKPYSYAVPYYRFSRVSEVRDRTGKVVRVVSDEDVADEVPIGGVRTGPRSVVWHDQAPATLQWVEALDDGDPKTHYSH